MSRIRQNYHSDSENGVNKQIGRELFASYVYLAMSQHFKKDDIALPGFAQYFGHQSDEERQHAQKLMTFQNDRGGRIVLDDIHKPTKQTWTSGLEAMKDALELEKAINQDLLDLHAIASKHNDAHMTNFLEEEYLEEQVKSIKEIGDHVTNLERVKEGLGEYLYDKHSLSS